MAEAESLRRVEAGLLRSQLEEAREAREAGQSREQEEPHQSHDAKQSDEVPELNSMKDIYIYIDDRWMRPCGACGARTMSATPS